MKRAAEFDSIYRHICLRTVLASRLLVRCSLTAQIAIRNRPTRPMGLQ